jgi:hypothetical protein
LRGGRSDLRGLDNNSRRRRLHRRRRRHRRAPAQGSRLRSMAGFGAAGVPGRVVAGEGGAELAHKAPGRSALGATTAGDGGSRSWKPGRSSSACWRRGEDCGAAATAAA